MVWSAQKSLDGDLKTEIRARYPLSEVADALADARAGGVGKVLLVAEAGRVSPSQRWRCTLRADERPYFGPSPPLSD